MAEKSEGSGVKVADQLGIGEGMSGLAKLMKVFQKMLEPRMDAWGTKAQLSAVLKAGAKFDKIVASSSSTTGQKLEVLDGKVNYTVVGRSEAPIEERAILRVMSTEINQQLNLEAAGARALMELTAGDQATASSDPVDEDWITRYADIVKDVSRPEMQMLWGRILAGEVMRPNSYSLRTMEVLRTVSFEEAWLLQRLSRLVVELEEEPFIFSGQSSALEDAGLGTKELLACEEIGVVSARQGLMMRAEPEESEDSQFAILTYGKRSIIIPGKEGKPIQFPAIALTRVGRELALLNPERDADEYFEAIQNYLRRAGHEFEVRTPIWDGGPV